MSRWDGYLRFFDRAVLSTYRASPDLYKLEEDDMGGTLESIHPRTTSWGQVRFAFRRLANGDICLAAFAPDIAKLPEQEARLWAGYLLDNLVFVQDDPAFKRWGSRYLQGSWQAQSGPRHRMDRQIRLIRALTNQTLGKPLLLSEQHDLVNYPVAENTDAYAKAHLELYRLVIDGFDIKVIGMLASHLSVQLSDPPKTLSSLKKLLPSDLIPTVHQPLMKCYKARQEIHGVPRKPASSFPAFDTFHQDLEAIAQALAELRTWLERVLEADAQICLKREQAMSLFPKFIGPPRPGFKLGQIKGAEGKTIDTVEFGEEPIYPGKHQSEGIILHFTDGTAMAVLIGSNAMNLSDQFEGLNPEEVSTDLMIVWAPSIKRRNDQLATEQPDTP